MAAIHTNDASALSDFHHVAFAWMASIRMSSGRERAESFGSAEVSATVGRQSRALLVDAIPGT